MGDRLGFMSAAGVAAAAIALLGLAAWAVVGGPAMFDPGPLNAVAKTQTLGGVASHAQLVGCEGCHTPLWSPVTMADKCVGCHTDVRDQMASGKGLHGRLFQGLASPTCRGCHVEHRGPDAPLTVADASFPHDLTGYSLRGHRATARGAKVTCADCHTIDLAHFDQSTCSACHSALDAAFMARHERGFGAQCLTCHDGSGRFGSDFDHAKLPFKLAGRHAGVACGRCHADTRSVQAFRATPSDCYHCHANVDRHRGAFGRQCGGCHTPAGWSGARFDHTAFPVDHGREQQAATCRTCHPTDISAYTCFGCHEHTPANIQAQHEGRSLAALADCIRCHAGGRTSGD